MKKLIYFKKLECPFVCLSVCLSVHKNSECDFCPLGTLTPISIPTNTHTYKSDWSVVALPKDREQLTKIKAHTFFYTGVPTVHLYRKS